MPGKVEKQHCPTCGSVVSEREIAMSTSMVRALWLIFKWCLQHETHRFRMRDVKHLIDQAQYSTFNNWEYFGGLVYRPEIKDPDTGSKKNPKPGGHYGLNLDRCEAFFDGKIQIPGIVWKHPVTKAIRAERFRYVHQFPKLSDFLNADGEFVALYRAPQPTIENIDRVFRIPSDSVKGMEYQVCVVGQKIICSCKSFRYRQKCAHIEKAKLEAAAKKEIPPNGGLFPGILPRSS